LLSFIFFYFLLLAFIFSNRDFSMRYGRFKQKKSPPPKGTTDAGKIVAQTAQRLGAERSAGEFFHPDIITSASALRNKMSSTENVIGS
jgi:hypothetical protein